VKKLGDPNLPKGGRDLHEKNRQSLKALGQRAAKRKRWMRREKVEVSEGGVFLVLAQKKLGILQ